MWLVISHNEDFRVCPIAQPGFREAVPLQFNSRDSYLWQQSKFEQNYIGPRKLLLDVSQSLEQPVLFVQVFVDGKKEKKEKKIESWYLRHSQMQRSYQDETHLSQQLITNQSGGETLNITLQVKIWFTLMTFISCLKIDSEQNENDLNVPGRQKIAK